MNRKILRTLQSHLPVVYRAKNWLYDQKMALTRSPMDADFLFLSAMPAVGNELVIDVGANRGQSIHALRLVRPLARVVAFEPQSGMIEPLRRRLRNDPMVRIEHCGLGATEAIERLFIPVYRGVVYDGLASFDRQTAIEWLNDERVFFFDPAALNLREEDCRIQPLDDFDLAPSFIKINVQGTEPAVVAGGDRTLRQHLPLVMVQRGPGSYEALAELGYIEVTPSQGRFVPGALPGQNAFYAHPSRL